MNVNEVRETPPLERATPEQESSKFVNSNENIAPKRSFFKSFFQRNLSIRKASYSEDLKNFIKKFKPKIGQKNETLRIIEEFVEKEGDITKGALNEAKKIIKNLKKEAYGNFKERKSNYKNLVELVKQCQCKNDLPEELTNLVKKGKNSKISNLAYETAKDIIKKTEDLNKTKEALRSAGYNINNEGNTNQLVFIEHTKAAFNESSIENFVHAISWPIFEFVEPPTKDSTGEISKSFIMNFSEDEKKYIVERAEFEIYKTLQNGTLKIGEDGFNNIFTNLRYVEVTTNKDGSLTFNIPLLTSSEDEAENATNGDQEKVPPNFFPSLKATLRDASGEIKKLLKDLGINLTELEKLKKDFESQYNELQNATAGLNKLLGIKTK